MDGKNDSLTCRSEAGVDFALATEGEHCLVVTDPAPGEKRNSHPRRFRSHSKARLTGRRGSTHFARLCKTHVV